MCNSYTFNLLFKVLKTLNNRDKDTNNFVIPNKISTFVFDNDY